MTAAADVLARLEKLGVKKKKGPQAGIDPFYENRPGADFVIGAGKPFEQSFEGEGHITDVRQLTFGGENAEAYFSPDGRHLIYQATVEEGSCDQQYVLDLATGELRTIDVEGPSGQNVYIGVHLLGQHRRDQRNRGAEADTDEVAGRHRSRQADCHQIDDLPSAHATAPGLKSPISPLAA